MGFFVPGDIPTVDFLAELERVLIAFADEEVSDFYHPLRLVRRRAEKLWRTNHRS